MTSVGPEIESADCTPGDGLVGAGVAAGVGALTESTDPATGSASLPHPTSTTIAAAARDAKRHERLGL